MTHLDPLTFGSEQMCFGCGPHNPLGWQLRFEVEDDTVITRFVPREGYDGPPGIFHGGLQATLMDELAGWTLVGLRSCMGFTRSMTTRYIRPVRIGKEVLARGRIVAEAPRSATVKVTLEQDGLLGSQSTVLYALPDQATVERTLQRELPDNWKKFIVP